MYNIRPTTKFQKDLKRVKKRGFDIPLLTDIIKKLAAGEPLPEKNRDHQLSVSENNIFNTCIYKHVRRNLTCVSSTLLEIHVLSSNLDVCSFCSLYNWYDIDSRYAEYYVYFFVSYKWF